MKQFALLTAISLILATFSVPVSAQDAPPAPAPNAKKEAFQNFKNPVPFSKKSIKRGKMWFVRECTACHGPDGKAQIDVVANATDLTKTIMWYSGFTEGEIFRSIRDGAGEAMPPYKSKIKKEDDIWHLVNFIKSLWPKDQRPKLVEDKPVPTDGETTNE